MRTKSALVAALLLGLSGDGVLAQSENPEWLDELSFQLQMEQQCKADYYLNIHEYDGPTGRSQSARVQCSDGRRFDATRAEPATEFVVKTCGNQVCGIEEPSNTGHSPIPVPNRPQSERSTA